MANTFYVLDIDEDPGCVVQGTDDATEADAMAAKYCGIFGKRTVIVQASAEYAPSSDGPPVKTQLETAVTAARKRAS